MSDQQNPREERCNNESSSRHTPPPYSARQGRPSPPPPPPLGYDAAMFKPPAPPVVDDGKSKADIERVKRLEAVRERDRRINEMIAERTEQALKPKPPVKPQPKPKLTADELAAEAEEERKRQRALWHPYNEVLDLAKEFHGWAIRNFVKPIDVLKRHCADLSDWSQLFGHRGWILMTGRSEAMTSFGFYDAELGDYRDPTTVYGSRCLMVRQNGIMLVETGTPSSPSSRRIATENERRVIPRLEVLRPANVKYLGNPDDVIQSMHYNIARVAHARSVRWP